MPYRLGVLYATSEASQIGEHKYPPPYSLWASSLFGVGDFRDQPNTRTRRADHSLNSLNVSAHHNPWGRVGYLGSRVDAHVLMTRRPGMARSFDPKKLALSQGRFRPFLDSGLAVGRFCAVEHVSVSSFYYWRMKPGLQALRRLARAIDRDARTENRGFFRPRQRGLTITTPAMKPTSMPGIASRKIRNRAVRRAMRHGRHGRNRHR